DPAALEARPNHALWWGVMRWAAANGYSSADLGEAVRGSRLEEFKRQFLACEVMDFRYEYRAQPAASRADAAVAAGATLGRRDAHLASWQRVVRDAWGRAPLPLTQLAGGLVLR